MARASAESERPARATSRTAGRIAMEDQRADPVQEDARHANRPGRDDAEHPQDEHGLVPEQDGADEQTDEAVHRQAPDRPEGEEQARDLPRGEPDRVARRACEGAETRMDRVGHGSHDRDRTRHDRRQEPAERPTGRASWCAMASSNRSVRDPSSSRKRQHGPGDWPQGFDDGAPGRPRGDPETPQHGHDPPGERAELGEDRPVEGEAVRAHRPDDPEPQREHIADPAADRQECSHCVRAHPPDDQPPDRQHVADPATDPLERRPHGSRHPQQEGGEDDAQPPHQLHDGPHDGPQGVDDRPPGGHHGDPDAPQDRGDRADQGVQPGPDRPIQRPPGPPWQEHEAADGFQGHVPAAFERVPSQPEQPAPGQVCGDEREDDPDERSPAPPCPVEARPPEVIRHRDAAVDGGSPRGRGFVPAAPHPARPGQRRSRAPARIRRPRATTRSGRPPPPPGRRRTARVARASWARRISSMRSSSSSPRRTPPAGCCGPAPAGTTTVSPAAGRPPRPRDRDVRTRSPPIGHLPRSLTPDSHT